MSKLTNTIEAVTSLIKNKSKKEESMKSFKELVEKVVEETNKQLAPSDQIKINAGINKTNTIIDILDSKGIIFTEERKGKSESDIDKCYGQLLKRIAINGILFTKAKFDSGEWGRG